jgi:hypothetical protein
MTPNPNFNHYVITRNTKPRQIVAGFEKASDAERMALIDDNYIVVGRGYIADIMPRYRTTDPLWGWDGDMKLRAMQHMSKSYSAFEKYLALAWIDGDGTNKRRIEAEFWFLFEKHGGIPRKSNDGETVQDVR